MATLSWSAGFSVPEAELPKLPTSSTRRSGPSEAVLHVGVLLSAGPRQQHQHLVRRAAAEASRVSSCGTGDRAERRAAPATCKWNGGMKMRMRVVPSWPGGHGGTGVLAAASGCGSIWQHGMHSGRAATVRPASGRCRCQRAIFLRVSGPVRRVCAGASSVCECECRAGRFSCVGELIFLVIMHTRTPHVDGSDGRARLGLW